MVRKGRFRDTAGSAKVTTLENLLHLPTVLLGQLGLVALLVDLEVEAQVVFGLLSPRHRDIPRVEQVLDPVVCQPPSHLQQTLPNTPQLFPRQPTELPLQTLGHVGKE